MTTARTWTPILEGARAEQAARAVDTIRTALDGGASGPGCNLAGGAAGQALFYAMLARTGAQGAETQASALLDRSIEWLAGDVTGSSLFSGYSGVAWVMENLRRTLWADVQDDEDPNEDIDEALRQELSVQPWTASYDLIQGLAGLGMYALERLPATGAAACLSLVIDRLGDLSEVHEKGIRWHTPMEQLMVRQTMERYPKGNYNLGVAHGVPGLIPVLAGACAAGIATARARPLLEGAVSWVLSCRLPPMGHRCIFPSVVADGLAPTSSRHAWCYGDPGVAMALLLAANVTGNDEWRAAAVETARHSAACPPPASGVADPGLCHGSTGLAHIFNRFFQSTGDSQFKDAALSWIDHTFTYQKPHGLGGFQSLLPVDMESGKLEWADDPSLLTGITGIGLTFLAASSTIEPTWDRVLGLSIPPVSGA